jgi:hypothetical protein
VTAWDRRDDVTSPCLFLKKWTWQTEGLLFARPFCLQPLILSLSLSGVMRYMFCSLIAMSVTPCTVLRVRRRVAWSVLHECISCSHVPVSVMRSVMYSHYRGCRAVWSALIYCECPAILYSAITCHRECRAVYCFTVTDNWVSCSIIFYSDILRIATQLMFFDHRLLWVPCIMFYCHLLLSVTCIIFYSHRLLWVQCSIVFYSHRLLWLPCIMF